MTILISYDVLPTRETSCISREDTILIACLWWWRNNTVRREDDRTIECLELFLLFPPCITIVAYKVLVFLQLWIIVSWEHLTMGINVYTSTLCLLQKLLNILQVVTRNKYTRTVTGANINLCKFWITVCLRVRFIKQCHCIYTEFTSFHYCSQQCIHVSSWVWNGSKSLLHESDDVFVALVEAWSMLVVSSHTLQA